MAEEDEASNHALMADEEEVPTEYALMAKSSSSSDNKVYNDSFCSKSCRKNIENLNNKIIKLNEELSDCETDLYNYKRGNQRLDKDKKGLGFNEYNAVPPPPAQVYSPPKKDLSWMGLPEFVDDTVTDYSRPTPSIERDLWISLIMLPRIGAGDLRTLKLDLKLANNGYGSPFVKISTHVYNTDIITVDQGRCEKWGMKLMKEVANPRCLSYNIRNPAVFSLSTRMRQRVLMFRGPRQEVVTKKNTISRNRSFA
ncbi:hypothetical protein Tco_1183297 [Tanacetum coccineum]